MNCRIFMLVYMADPSIEDMTRAAVYRVLENSSASITVAFNGGKSFSLDADDKLTVTAWEDRMSLGVAYNRLVNATNERFICLMHNDCFIPVGTIEALTEKAEKYGLAFPVVRHDLADCQIRGVAETSPALPPSCCYVITREAWKKLGGFDEVFEGCHFEDMDLFLRARLMGYRTVQVGDCEVFHRRGVTRALTADDSNAAFIANRIRYMEKWGRGGMAPVPELQQEGDLDGGPSYFSHSIGGQFQDTC